MKVLKVEFYTDAYVSEIENTENSFDSYVLGRFTCLRLSKTAGLVCNKNGVFAQLRPNRVVGNDMIFGDFLVVGLAGKSFCDLSEKDIEKYLEMFKKPELVYMKDADNYALFSYKQEGVDFLTYHILQCTEESEFTFFDLKYARAHNFGPDKYRNVYYGIEKFDKLPLRICQKLYESHNAYIHDCRGHVLSVSDIIVIHYPAGDRYFYVNPIGFEELKNFLG